MPFAASNLPPPPAAPPLPGQPGVKRETEIVVIPEKFYGVALKMKPPFATLETVAPAPTPTPPPKPKPAVVPLVKPVRGGVHWPLVALIVFLILAVAGGFVYFNRDLIFKKPVTPVTPVATTPEVPPSPSNLMAVSPTPASVTLSWSDISALENGYRLERKEEQGTYLTVSNLPANSTTFLDTSVQAGKTYTYRAVAINQAGESLPSNEAGVTVVALPVVASSTPSLPPGGLDSDSDGLTDLEETTVYRTDTNSPDTDGDHYNDGNEVFHLYDPTKAAPSALADSGLVKIFSAPAGWSLLVPADWSATLNSPDGSTALIDTGHGETFTIAILDNTAQLSLRNWYLSNHPGVDPETVHAFATKKSLDGILDAARLDAYFIWSGKVFEIKYLPDGQSYVNYRTTYEMMMNSLILSGVPQVTNTAESLLGPGSFVGTSTEAILPAIVPTSTVTATSSLPVVSNTSTAPLENTTSTPSTSTNP